MDTISTGSYDLNELLEGGYERGIVTMVVGPPGSGKTNLSILVACSQAKEKKVIYVDTEGGFSVERVKQIVGNENYEKILSNILLLNPTNFVEQKESFNKLNKYLSGENVGLVIVDSMAMLYRLELGDAVNSEEDSVKEVNRDIAKQMRTLVEIARKENICVFITNQVYSSFISGDDLFEGREKKVKIVGGDLFQYWSKCIIELKQKGMMGARKVLLLKHRSLDNKGMNFEIENKGIFKRGMF